MHVGARSLIAGLSVMLVSGCAALSPIQLGQTAGTIAGAAAVPGLGAPLGALLGTVVGSVFQKEVDKVTEKRERKELTEQFGQDRISSSASLRAARPQGEPIRVWVDEVMRDGDVLTGHFEMRHL